MSLLERIEQDFKESLRQKSNQLDVLRGLKSALQNKEISLKRKKLSDEDIIEVIRQERKKRQEAQELFIKGGRLEMAEKELREMEFLKKYLPEELSGDRIKEIVDKVIQDLGATGKQDFGKVMGKVMAEVKGKAEGNKVKKIVEEELN